MFLFHLYRLMGDKTRLEDLVPMLTNYTGLKNQFDWLLDGQIESLVSYNLKKELPLMERILRNQGNEEVNEEFRISENEANANYSGSPDMFKWVGVLRAADIFWNRDSGGKAILILYQAEALVDGSPRIVVRTDEK